MQYDICTRLHRYMLGCTVGVRLVVAPCAMGAVGADFAFFAAAATLAAAPGCGPRFPIA